MTGRFEGKQALVLGVANQRSIAWAIAKRLADEGASVAFTYQGERIEKNVRDLAATVDSPLVTECDVRSDDDLARVFAETSDAFGGGLDILVHSVAFAAAEVVRLDHALDRLRRCGDERSPPRDAGVVDEKSDCRVAREHVRGDLVDPTTIAHVACLPLGADLARERLETVGPSREKHAVPPALRELSRGCLPDARRGARHDRYACSSHRRGRLAV